MGFFDYHKHHYYCIKWDTATEWGATETVSISIGENGLTPDRVTIEERTVVWTNDDSEPHNVTADDGSFDSGSMSTGDTFSFTFSSQGTWTFTDPSTGLSKFEGRVTVGAETSQTLPDAFNLDEDIMGLINSTSSPRKEQFGAQVKRSLRSLMEI